MKKNYLFVLFLILTINQLLAQRPGGEGGQRGGGGAPIARVYGRILDAGTGEPIPYVSVIVKPMRKDTVAGGTLTKTNGYFDISGLNPGMYQLKLSAIGYTDTTLQVRLTPPNPELDAGDIRIGAATQSLQEVTITGERSSVQLAVDRRVYSVDRNLAATGGTAIDALKTIPSVSVDADGNVELRNSTPRVFVDGKPSPLTLDQIPAAEIDKVEIITNPSAKYEASAAGGIINVVLKKSKLPGIFSLLSMGVGTNDRLNGMASINARQKPFAFNLSYNYNTGKNPAYQFNDIDRFSGTTLLSSFRQGGINNHMRSAHFVRAGVDYDLNARNAISLSGNWSNMYMRFKDNQDISNTLGTNILDYTSTRDALGIRKVDTYSGQLDYKRSYPTNGHEWTSFLQYSYNRSNGLNTSEQRFFDSQNVEWPQSPDIIKSDGGSRANTVQFQTDYAKPLGEHSKFEIGARFQYKDNISLTTAQRTDSTGELANFPLLSINYAYEEIISAAYGNYIGRKGKLGYQGGLRLESSIFDGRQPGGDSTFSYRFPSSWGTLQYLFFPSVFLTYQLNEGQDLQFNLARKLERPNFFQVMPFVMQTDNQNYRAGNPNLLPEFRYTAELNYALTKSWGSFFSSVYGRHETQSITGVVYRADDGTEALINTFINGRSNNRIGLEESLKYKIVKNLEATVGVNIFRNSVKATLHGVELNRTGWNWDTRGNIEYRFLKNWVLQANGEYEAPRITAQGRNLRNYGMDLALKRNFNPLGSVTFLVNDVFNTKGRGSLLYGDNYIQRSWRRREVRFFQISVQLRFGKPDAALFKKTRQPRQMQGGGDMDF